jgi:hypothetical protein
VELIGGSNGRGSRPRLQELLRGDRVLRPRLGELLQGGREVGHASGSCFEVIEENWLRHRELLRGGWGSRPCLRELLRGDRGKLATPPGATPRWSGKSATPPGAAPRWSGALGPVNGETRGVDNLHGEVPFIVAHCMGATRACARREREREVTAQCGSRASVLMRAARRSSDIAVAAALRGGDAESVCPYVVGKEVSWTRG